MTPPLLSKPNTGEDLFLYLAVSANAVSAALIRKETNNQKPAFYVSKALIAAETRYMKMEKLILALIVALKKQNPTFKPTL